MFLQETIEIPADTNFCGYSTYVQQDILGRNVAESNRQGGIVYCSYDMMNNPVSITHSYDQYRCVYTYDHAGNVLTQTETGVYFDKITRKYEYDMLGRKISETDGNGNKSSYSYYGQGWIKEVKNPFDSAGNALTKYKYDKLGNVIEESIKNSKPNDSDKFRTTKYEYDYLDRVTKSLTGNDYTTYEYDKAGNVLKSVMANGTQTVSYEYDQLNRPTKYTDAMSKSETYTYNQYGDMTQKVDRNGITTSYTYNPVHNLTKESVTKNGVTTANTYTYGKSGQLVSESNGNATKSYRAYKYADRIRDEETVVIDGVQHKIVRTYHEYDKIMNINYYKGDSENTDYSRFYDYDERGRIRTFYEQSVSEYFGVHTSNVAYEYDKNDNMTKANLKKDASNVIL